MILEVLEWPESQEVMDNPEWFFIMGITDSGDEPIGDSSYARVLDESEYDMLASENKHLANHLLANGYNKEQVDSIAKGFDDSMDEVELTRLKLHNDDHILQSELEE